MSLLRTNGPSAPAQVLQGTDRGSFAFLTSQGRTETQRGARRGCSGATVTTSRKVSQFFLPFPLHKRSVPRAPLLALLPPVPARLPPPPLPSRRPGTAGWRRARSRAASTCGGTGCPSCCTASERCCSSTGPVRAGPAPPAAGAAGAAGLRGLRAPAEARCPRAL